MNYQLRMYRHEYPGTLITFCGLDGSGKSTMIHLLADYLKQNNKEVVLTKQPTEAMRHTEIFRTYMDQEDHSRYAYRALSLMAAADRIQHVHQVILPALQEGKYVLCDRYYYSCLANLHARGYEQDAWVHEISQEIVKPDLAFFLDVPVSIAIQRVRSRPEERSRYIDVQLQNRLHDEYKKIAANNAGIILSSCDIVENTCQNMMSYIRRLRK